MRSQTEFGNERKTPDFQMSNANPRDWNTDLQSVRPADILSAAAGFSESFSGVALRWARRPEAYVPV